MCHKNTCVWMSMTEVQTEFCGTSDMMAYSLKGPERRNSLQRK